MDRFTVNTAKSQMGFIDVIAGPTFETVKNILPSFEPFYLNLETNKSLWRNEIEFYDEELSKHY